MKRLLIIPLLLLSLTLGATKVYVATTGNDATGDGTSGNPYLTIATGISHAFAGDTSNYPVPDKIGNLFIDTSASKVYVSVSTSRGGWVILNILFAVFYVRRRRK